MNAFTGFPSDAWQFLDELATDNDATFFDAHRQRYRQAVAEPSAALVDAVTPRLQAFVHAGLRGEPTVGRSLFRINRDTRFGHRRRTGALRPSAGVALGRRRPTVERLLISAR